MDAALYKIAARACKEVYDDNIDLGTTEYQSWVRIWKGNPIQVLAIAGTNELADWWKNFNVLSWKGIKYPALKAAEEVNADFGRIQELPLLVCGHSKAGATAIAYKRIFGADFCIAFAPARSLRYWTDRNMDDTAVFIDPDDPVSKVACISFGHPICTTKEAKRDHILPWVSDHFMARWIDFTESMA